LLVPVVEEVEIEEEPAAEEEEDMFKAIMGSNSKVKKSIEKREKAMEVEAAVRNAAAKASGAKSSQKGSQAKGLIFFFNKRVKY